MNKKVVRKSSLFLFIENKNPGYLLVFGHKLQIKNPVHFLNELDCNSL